MVHEIGSKIPSSATPTVKWLKPKSPVVIGMDISVNANSMKSEFSWF